MDDNERGPGSGESRPSTSLDGQGSESGAFWMDDNRMLFIPAHPEPASGPDTITLERRLLPGGVPVAMGFTTLDKLVEALGEYQPWVALEAGRLREVLVGTRSIVAIDPSVPHEAIRWTAADVVKAAADKAEIEKARAGSEGADE